jgi:hypothetical protein
MRYFLQCARRGMATTLCQLNSTSVQSGLASDRFVMIVSCLSTFTSCLRELISQEGVDMKLESQRPHTHYSGVVVCAARYGNDHVPRSDKNVCTPISVCSGPKPVDSGVVLRRARVCYQPLAALASKPSRRPTVPGRGSRHSCSHSRIDDFRPPHTVGNNLT